MPTEEIIFKHPPATEVQLAVTFPNNLAVADQRSKFHDRVRAGFPTVIIPEQNKLAYDFGDYTLQKQDMSERLEIGMNYFRLVSSRYLGFAKFRAVFLDALDAFSECYDVKSYAGLLMSYRNVLPLEGKLQFEKVFTLNISLPQSLETELFAGQGLLAFQKPQGNVIIQLEPKVEGSQVTAYFMNLLFNTSPDKPHFDKALVSDLAGTAHDYLRRFFFGVLQPPYLEYLAKR